VGVGSGVGVGDGLAVGEAVGAEEGDAVGAGTRVEPGLVGLLVGPAVALADGEPSGDDVAVGSAVDVGSVESVGSTPAGSVGSPSRGVRGDAPAASVPTKPGSVPSGVPVGASFVPSGPASCAAGGEASPDQRMTVNENATATTSPVATVARPTAATNRPVRRARRDPPGVARLEIRSAIEAPSATDGRAAAWAAAGAREVDVGDVGTSEGHATAVGTLTVAAAAADLGAADLRPRLGVLTGDVVLADVAATAAIATAGSGVFRRRAGFLAAASGRAKGAHARHAPAVRFQQFRQTVFSHDEQVRIVESAAAPAAIWS
jgi:hypothetical protein